MFKIPDVPSAEDLIDKAYKAGSMEAKRARAMGPKVPEKILTGEIRRVLVAGNIITGHLNAIVERFPQFEDLSEFHQYLLDLRVKKDKYKKSIGAVNWAADRVESLQQKTLRKLKTTKDTEQSMPFLGRAASFVKRVKSDLKFLQDVKKALRSFPFFKDEPTLVVAGIPNAGKSTFVRTLTGSKIKVASYPFTTTDIMIGYKSIRHDEYQIIDSPGILDRPMSERNHVELQAILAIRHLADFVLYIIDPQADLQQQLNLLKEIRDTLRVETYVAVNDKGTGVPEGYAVFNAQDEADCVRIFRECFGIVLDSKGRAIHP
ncbi:MAG: GTPase [Candidatus Altiarchaeota archaeon]